MPGGGRGLREETSLLPRSSHEAPERYPLLIVSDSEFESRIGRVFSTKVGILDHAMGL